MRRLPDLAYRIIGRLSVLGPVRWLHPRLYRRTGGVGILGQVLGTGQILLVTRGARSGLARSVALFAVDDPASGGRIVVGSRGGSGRVPDWARNLEADPRAEIQVHGRRERVRATFLDGDAYERAFDLAAASYPGFRVYRAAATHWIPVIHLESREPDAA